MDTFGGALSRPPIGEDVVKNLPVRDREVLVSEDIGRFTRHPVGIAHDGTVKDTGEIGGTAM
jgi:hypothetical protein